MYLWIYFILIIVLFIFVNNLLRKYKLASTIYSSKKNLPLIGSAHLVSNDSENIMEIMKEISIECSENGGILKLWLGPLLYLLLTDPVKIDEILKYHLEKDRTIKVLRSVTGNGSIFAPVSVWRRRRKVMVAALNPKFVTSFFDIFLKRSQKLADEIAPKAMNKTPFSIWSYINSYNFDVTWESAMGKSTILGKNKNKILNSMTVMKSYLSARMFNVCQRLDWMFRFHTNYAEVELHKKIAYAFTDEVVQQKRSEFYDDDAEHDNMIEKNKNTTVFDRFMSFSKRNKLYSNLELREELITLFIAATDTCTNVIDYILILMGKYPTVQQKVYEELQAAFQDQNMLPNNKDDLLKLQYMERVINETLRLFPPAPFVVRKTTKETAFDDGVIIPENTSILVSIWGLHRNKKYWGPDADCFDPDRFLPNRYSRIPPGSYVPFLSGSRNCPGFAFAMTSLKTVLSVILKTYRVVPDPEDGPVPNIRVKFDITMTATDDRVALEKRC